jgi:hypothetical protein
MLQQTMKNLTLLTALLIVSGGSLSAGDNQGKSGSEASFLGPVIHPADAPRITAGLTDDSNEDNDSFDTATVVAAGATVDNQVLLDDDWYLLSFNNDQHLELIIEFDHSQGDINAQLYDRRGALLGETYSVEVASGYSRDNNERLTYVNASGSTQLYLRVYGELGATNPSYRIVQNLVTRDDEFELQNDASCGTLATLDTSITYDGFVLRDDDWYRLDVSSINTLTVVLNHEYFSGDLDIMITEDTGTCSAYDRTLALGNVHNPFITEQVTADVRGLNTVLIRIYGEQRQKNFYGLTFQVE